MKKGWFFLCIALVLLSCPNPVLKWIDTPGEPGRMSMQLASAKEIVFFTFGIAGETDLPIVTKPDYTGTIPISIILPEGNSVKNRAPRITFIGKYLSPRSGEPEDFTLPLRYTVTANDNSTQDYMTHIYVKSQTSKEIVRFAVELSSGLFAEGYIEQGTGIITVQVPSGTNRGALTAHVAHTGTRLEAPHGETKTDVTFTFNGDFSSPTTWTVIAGDESTKTYTVNVEVEKNHDKEITRFSLGLAGEYDIIGGEPQPDGKYPIVVVVPSTSPLPSLAGRMPYINYRGEAISPGETQPRDFSSSNPVVYTVRAEDRSTRDYVVKVVLAGDTGTTGPQITRFYLTNPWAEGAIDQKTSTITLPVPVGTDLSNLNPTVIYSGDSLNPVSGSFQDFSSALITLGGPWVKYTVRQAGFSDRTYDVIATYISGPPSILPQAGTGGKVDMDIDASGKYTVIVEYPIYIENPVVNINNQVVNTTNYPSNDYTLVIVTPPSTPGDEAAKPPSIDTFYFNEPAAIGNIDQGTGAITVTVPYGTDIRGLKATIVYTGTGIEGVPGSSPLKEEPRSFTDQVTYTVNGSNGASKTYTVTVTVSPNSAKQITDFSFSGVSNTSAIISAMPNKAGEYPIVVTVPSGTGFPFFTPVVTHNGASISGPSGLTNFSTDQPYTVTAADGSFRTYTVTVREAVSTGADEPKITGFFFTDPVAVGTVNEDSKTITVAVPSGTNVKNLRPQVLFDGVSVSPASGAANDFSGPASYTVTGINGKTKTYTVKVTAALSNTKEITHFEFPGIVNSETVIGAVPSPDGTYPVSVWVPAGTSLISLAPAITHTGVKVDPEGGKTRNFSLPRTYTVTAEDGTTRTYTVRVNIRDSDIKIITSFIFEGIPLSGGGFVRVPASIDQTSHHITAEVPSNADISLLKPFITYLGRSIVDPAGAEKTANPLTGGTGVNFTGAQTYTVTDQNGVGQLYIVEVIKKSSVNVQFTGESELAFTTRSFDPGTGVVTVKITTTAVDPPYEWYLDGVKQAVSADTFNVNVADPSFLPGRHEITVSGMKNGLHWTGKIYFVVSE